MLAAAHTPLQEVPPPGLAPGTPGDLMKQVAAPRCAAAPSCSSPPCLPDPLRPPLRRPPCVRPARWRRWSGRSRTASA